MKNNLSVRRYIINVRQYIVNAKQYIINARRYIANVRRYIINVANYILGVAIAIKNRNSNKAIARAGYTYAFIVLAVSEAMPLGLSLYLPILNQQVINALKFSSIMGNER